MRSEADWKRWRLTDPQVGYVVLASAKSGTTWAQRLLSAHPGVHCGETRPFGDYFKPDNPSSPHMSLERYAGLLGRYVHPPVGEAERTAFERALVMNLWDAVARTAKAAGGKPLYGEKITPFEGTAARVVEMLAAYDASMPFVHLVRDGRDVAVSGFVQRANLRLRKASGAEHERLRAALSAQRVDDDELDFFTGLWVDANRAALAADGLERRMLLRYEDMLERPVAEATRLVRFIGADAGEAVVRSCVEAASFERLSGGRSAGEEDRSSFFRRGVAGDWRNWLTSTQAERFEARAGDLLDAFGYERAASGAGAGSAARAAG